MITIDLNNLHGIPSSYITEVHSHGKLMKQNPFFDEIQKIPVIEQLIKKIDTFCRENFIYGYHYSNIIPGDIEKNGMLIRTGEEIRRTFLEKFEDRFSSDEIELIKSAWNRYYDHNQVKARDNVIYFNFTLRAFNTSDSEFLLSFHGGEQCYMGLLNIKSLYNKLCSLGSPAIIKCRLDPNQVKTFNSHTWGSIMVSKIHCLYNNDACLFDQDGRFSQPILPKDCSVIYLKKVNNKRYLPL